MAERNEMAGKTRHPLAVTLTELVWEGKYGVAGNCVAAGEYTLVVMVIGVLGNDTTKTVRVKVK
jgi:hypothetical protein